MNEGVYIKVAKGDFGARRFPVNGAVGIGEHCSFVVKKIVKEVVL